MKTVKSELVSTVLENHFISHIACAGCATVAWAICRWQDLELEATVATMVSVYFSIFLVTSVRASNAIKYKYERLQLAYLWSTVSAEDKEKAKLINPAEDYDAKINASQLDSEMPAPSRETIAPQVSATPRSSSNPFDENLALPESAEDDVQLSINFN